MSSRFSYVTPGMERFSFYLPRAVIIIIIIIVVIIILFLYKKKVLLNQF